MSLTFLALDTSTEACSVALYHQGEITHLDEMAQRTHTKRILPMLDQILAQSGLRLNQVDALAFGRGPGSFTGVRVGSGIAQGLALGADLPVLPVSNLMAMAQAGYEQHGAEQVLCAIDARMDEVYFALYQRQSSIEEPKVRPFFPEFFWQATIAEQVAKPEAVLAQLASQSLAPNAIKVGTGWGAYAELQNCDVQASEILLPSARYMLPIAYNMWQQKQFISAMEIEPVYLRNEVTWKKLPGRE